MRSTALTFLFLALFALFSSGVILPKYVLTTFLTFVLQPLRMLRLLPKER